MIDAKTRESAVYDLLRNRILELEYAPGDRLIEADIAQRLGVSKTPIREVLLKLDAEGLVRRIPYQGATVTWLSLTEYQELLFIQDALEQAALPIIAARLKPQVIVELDALVLRLADQRRRSDSLEYSRTTLRIHERLVGTLGSSRVLSYLVSLMSGPGRRYQKILTHQFEDTWDLECNTIVRRYELVRDGNVAAAQQFVAAAHAKLALIAESRLTDAKVARYFGDPESPDERALGLFGHVDSG
jgi:DNA-binding GntR family transcriptional regulator